MFGVGEADSVAVAAKVGWARIRVRAMASVLSMIFFINYSGRVDVWIIVNLAEEVEFSESTAVILTEFSPLIKFMSVEKAPSWSAVTIISSTSVIMAMFEFGLVIPLRDSIFSVVTELSCGVETDIRLSLLSIVVGEF